MNMIKKLAALFCLCLLLMSAGCGSQSSDEDSAEQGRVIMNYDASGHSVKTVYKDVPGKVLILYPGAAETMLELGLDDHILSAISPYGEEPASIAAKYDALPKLQAAFIPSVEEVFAMQPDLIIGWAHNFSPTELGSVQDWKAHKIPVYIVPATLKHDRPTLENSVYPFLEDMGRIFQREEKAAEFIAACRQREAAVEQSVKDKPVKTAIVLQDHGKSSYSLYGPDYLINDLLNKAGLENLVKQRTSFIGPERVLSNDPDYLIFVSLPDSDGKDLSDEEVVKLVQSNRDLTSLRAVREGRIINIPFAEVNSGNQRSIDALERLLHGRMKGENF